MQICARCLRERSRRFQKLGLFVGTVSGTYADSDEELVEIDMTITVSVEKSHDGVAFVAGDTDLDLAETSVELLRVDLVVSVEGVEVSEGSSETADGLGTSRFDLSTDVLKNYSQDRHR